MPLPRGRTGLYGVWRACERLGVRPPGVKDKYEDCDLETQCHIFAYNNIREQEEYDVLGASLGVPKNH